MPHVQVCTYPGRHTHMVTRDALGGQRKRWEVIDETQGAVSRLSGQDGLFKALWKPCGIKAWHLPPPVSRYVEAGGGHYIPSSVTLHLRQGLLLNPELTSWLGWLPVSPGVCLLALQLWDPGAFSCSQLLCGYRGPHSGPHSVKAGTFIHPQPL